MDSDPDPDSWISSSSRRFDGFSWEWEEADMSLRSCSFSKDSLMSRAISLGDKSVGFLLEF